MESAEIIVTGRVQGVFFRVSTKRKADELGLTGTVQNLRDGSVKVIASGRSEDVQRLIEWCHAGPELARVNNVTVTRTGTAPGESFDVIR